MNQTAINQSNASEHSTCSSSSQLHATLQVVLFSMIIIMSFLGNTLVIIIVTQNKRMHTLSNLLIRNTSIADLLVTSLPMIWEVVSLRHFKGGTWPMGSFMCIAVYLCTYISVACSIISLTVIAIDRYFLIMMPHKKGLDPKYNRCLIALIWFLSFLLSSPTLIAQQIWTDAHTGKKFCVEMWNPPFDSQESPKHYTIILFLLLYALPLLSMAVLYSIMCLYLWRWKMPGARNSSSSKSHRQKKKVVLMLVTVLLIFAIGWFPVFLSQFLIFFNPRYVECPRSFPRALVFVAYFFQYLSSALNPFVYFLLSPSYRSGLAKLVNWEGRKRKTAVVHLKMQKPRSQRSATVTEMLYGEIDASMPKNHPIVEVTVGGQPASEHSVQL